MTAAASHQPTGNQSGILSIISSKRPTQTLCLCPFFTIIRASHGSMGTLNIYPRSRVHVSGQEVTHPPLSRHQCLCPSPCVCPVYPRVPVSFLLPKWFRGRQQWKILCGMPSTGDNAPPLPLYCQISKQYLLKLDCSILRPIGIRGLFWKVDLGFNNNNNIALIALCHASTNIL